MATDTFTVPMMYGDHHVQAVRQLLSALTGVTEVYASSSFHIVEVAYDEDVLTSESIEQSLENAGYLGEIELPVETGATDAEQPPFFRHTSVSQPTGANIGFAQTVPYLGRPLWSCPGMGVIKLDPDE